MVTLHYAKAGVGTNINNQGYSATLAAGGTYSSVQSGMVIKDEVSQLLRIITPHEETLNDLDKKKYQLTQEQRAMYKTTSKDLSDFADDLKRLGAQGYTRTEGWGSGTTPEKRQWVWNVTWVKGKEVKIDQILQAYEKRFHRSSGIYIEEYYLGETLFNVK